MLSNRLETLALLDTSRDDDLNTESAAHCSQINSTETTHVTADAKPLSLTAQCLGMTSTALSGSRLVSRRLWLSYTPMNIRNSRCSIATVILDWRRYTHSGPYFRRLTPTIDPAFVPILQSAYMTRYHSEMSYIWLMQVC